MNKLPRRVFLLRLSFLRQFLRSRIHQTFCEKWNFWSMDLRNVKKSKEDAAMTQLFTALIGLKLSFK